MTALILALLLVGAALSVARKRPGQRLSRLRPTADHSPEAPAFAVLRGVRRRPSPAVPDRQEIADLVGRLAALTRAGVPPGRAWQVLSVGGGPGTAIAKVTADMVASGGSTADGLRLVLACWPPSHGPPGSLDAVGWLALATDVIERSGAPSAAVYDGMAAGILAELARIDEQEVSLAGARTTATLLAALPLVGAALGFAMGANVVVVLLGSAVGHLCLVIGITAWITGRLWTRHLVTKAASAT